MGKLQKITLVIAAVSLLICLAIFLGYSMAGRGENRIYHLSIIYSPGSDYSTNLRRGADNAALEYQVDLMYIQLSDNADAEQVQEYIRQESEGDADAIIVFPGSGINVEGLVWDSANKPVVMIGAQSEIAAVSVSPDYYELGYVLGCEIAQNHRAADVFEGSGGGAAAKQLDGLLAAFHENGVSFQLVGNDYVSRAEDERAAVAVEHEVLSSLYSGSRGYGGIYGFERSGDALFALEEGRVSAIATYSFFELGYSGVVSALDAIDSPKTNDVTIKGYVITTQNIFESPYEQVLFPLA